MVIDVNELHSLKASSSMLVILVGIVTDVTESQYIKALTPILVKDDGTSIVGEQPKNDVNAFTDDGIAARCICVCAKANLPTSVTLVGIVIEVSDVHDIKASSPILVTLVGIVTDVSDVHDLNASLAILVTVVAKVT